MRFRAGVSQQDKDTIIATHGARRKKLLNRESAVEKLELSGGRDAKAAVVELSLNPQVEFAELNYLIAKDDVQPNDPQFDQQWALRNTGQQGGQYGSDIGAATAWQTMALHAKTLTEVAVVPVVK